MQLGRWPRIDRPGVKPFAAGIVIAAIALAAVVAVWLAREPATVEPGLRSDDRVAADTSGADAALAAVRRAWLSELERVRELARGIAVNDDTYEFVRRPNFPYVDEYFRPEKLAALGIDTVLVLDAERKPIFWRRPNDPANEGFPDAERFLAAMPTFAATATPAKRGEPVVEGAVRFVRGTTLATVIPVVPRSRPGEPRGYVVFGRSLDGAPARRIVESAMAPVDVLAPTDAQLNARARARLALAHGLTPVVIVEPEYVRGFLPLHDVLGQLERVYAVNLPRAVHLVREDVAAPVRESPWPLLAGATLLLLLFGGGTLWWAYSPERPARRRDERMNIERLAEALAREAQSPQVSPAAHAQAAEALVRLGATADEPPPPPWLAALAAEREGDVDADERTENDAAAHAAALREARVQALTAALSAPAATPRSEYAREDAALDDAFIDHVLVQGAAGGEHVVDDVVVEGVLDDTGEVEDVPVVVDELAVAADVPVAGDELAAAEDVPVVADELAAADDAPVVVDEVAATDDAPVVVDQVGMIDDLPARCDTPAALVASAASESSAALAPSPPPPSPTPAPPRETATPALRHAQLLRGLIEAGRVSVHYQPQVSTVTGAIVGVEALLRWQDEAAALRCAAELFDEDGPEPFAAATEFVLRRACADRRHWLAQVGRSLPVSVNVGLAELRDPTFLDRVSRILEACDLAPAYLELEVPEAALSQSHAAESAALDRAYRLGLGIAIGGFVAADAPLRAITNVPVAKLKVDRSLTADLPHDEHARSVVGAILAVGRTLGVAVCAEGVETAAQAEFLERNQCPLMQGWHYGRPMDADRFLELLKGSGVDTMRLPLMDMEELESHARAAGLA